MQARAGVLTGEAAVTLGAVGQGMVAGDLVNTASRLQSVAAPGTVLVGEATQRAASSAIVFEPAGEQTLKGKELPVSAWRGGARRQQSARAAVAATGWRHRSSAAKRSCACSRTCSTPPDASSACGLSRSPGQAGIGKTRLAWEFLKYVDGVVEGVWWHDGRSPSLRRGHHVLGARRDGPLPGRVARDGRRATTRAKVTETVVTHVPDEEERRWIEPALLALLGVGEAPAGGRDELFRAWRTFFERMASTGIVALVFEDLQWADAGLLDFIDHLLEWSRGVPILIMTLARPELLDRRPDWGAGRRNFLALGLEPLPEAAMRELLAGLVPGLPADDRALDHRPRRRHPAVRGRDRPDACRRGRWPRSTAATSRSASSASWPCPRRSRR